jgi:tripartite-type tricarboxylate transporter receptor subunit TctC
MPRDLMRGSHRQGLRKAIALPVILVMVHLLAALSAGSEAAPAPAWKPARPVTLVVTAATGGGLDINARILAQYGEKHLNQRVQVVNRVGGNNQLGFSETVRSRPDGETVVMVHTSIVTDPYLVKDSLYRADAMRPLVQIAYDPNVLVVPVGSPLDLPLKDLMAYGKQHDGDLKVGVGGMWTGHDFTRVTTEMAGGFTMRRVGFGGGGPNVTALLGGHVDLAITFLSESYQQVKAGQLKVIAVAGPERSQALPDVPTFIEMGYPEISWGIWRMLAVPKTTPDEIVYGWQDAMKKTLDDPATKAAYEKAGIQMVYRGADDCLKFIKSEDARFKAVIDKLGLKPQ